MINPELLKSLQERKIWLEFTCKREDIPQLELLLKTGFPNYEGGEVDYTFRYYCATQLDAENTIYLRSFRLPEGMTAVPLSEFFIQEKPLAKLAAEISKENSPVNTGKTGLNLPKLEKELDGVLAEETPETLTEYLKNERVEKSEGETEEFISFPISLFGPEAKDELVSALPKFDEQKVKAFQEYAAYVFDPKNREKIELLRDIEAYATERDLKPYLFIQNLIDRHKNRAPLLTPFPFQNSAYELFKERLNILSKTIDMSYALEVLEKNLILLKIDKRTLETRELKDVTIQNIATVSAEIKEQLKIINSRIKDIEKAMKSIKI